MATIPSCQPTGASLPETVGFVGYRYYAIDDGTGEVVGEGETPAEAREAAEETWADTTMDDDEPMPSIHIVSRPE